MYLPPMEICCMFGMPPTEPLEFPSPQCRTRKWTFPIAILALGSRCQSMMLLLQRKLRILHQVKLQMVLRRMLRAAIQQLRRQMKMVKSSDAGRRRPSCQDIGPATSQSQVSSRSSYRGSGLPPWSPRAAICQWKRKYRSPAL